MPAPTFRMADGAYRRRHTQVPPYEYDGLPRMVRRAGTSPDTVRHKAAVHHPVRGGNGGLRLCRGLRHLRMALWDDGGFRAVRGAGISPAATGDQRLCLWSPRFRQRAAGWQEVSARNFASEQGAAMAQKARRHPQTHRWQVATQKKTSKTLIFGCIRGHGAQHIGGVAVQPRQHFRVRQSRTGVIGRLGQQKPGR